MQYRGLKMRLSVNQLRRIIREEKEKVLDEIEVDLENPSGANGDHHWPAKTETKRTKCQTC